MRKSKEQFYPPYHHFCCSCDNDEKMSMGELMTHVKAVHGVDLEGKKAHKELILHMNKRPRHTSIYKLSCAGLTFYEYYG